MISDDMGSLVYKQTCYIITFLIRINNLKTNLHYLYVNTYVLH